MKMSFAITDAARAVRAPLDYPMLVASIAGRQSASRTAMLAARLAPVRGAGVAHASALAALILEDRNWSAAAAALGGSFHPGVARWAAGKARSTNMKPAFTFAF